MCRYLVLRKQETRARDAAEWYYTLQLYARNEWHSKVQVKLFIRKGVTMTNNKVDWHKRRSILHLRSGKILNHIKVPRSLFYFFWNPKRSVDVSTMEICTKTIFATFMHFRYIGKVAHCVKNVFFLMEKIANNFFICLY